MRGLMYWVMTMLAALSFASVASADTLAPGERHLAMRLVPESASPRAGSTVALAITVTPQPRWHGYWINPGDAGFADRFVWTVPKGVSTGPIAYPVPQRLLIAGLMNHVYERPYALMTSVTVPAGLAAGTVVPIAAKADYLVCTDTLCVPESAQVATTVTIGDGAVTPHARTQFAAWRAALPSAATPARFAIAGDRIRFAIPAGAANDAHFFAITTGAIDYAAPQIVSRVGGDLIVETRRATGATGQPAAIEGVLSTGDGRGVGVKAVPGTVPTAKDAATGDDTAGSAGSAAWSTALLAFAGAVLGGLILNIMPCVFPILSLKALSLAKSGGDERAARAEALAYTAGVVLVCLALGAGLLVLRAAGSTVGWAFQLQDPRVIGVLLLLVTGIALNLAGLFELPTPQFAGSSGTTGAFATGALAAFVATPCTGPFMGAALGAALVLPTIAALLVFAGLGLGIALPFLLLGFVPVLRRRLPRPGLWMATLRRILSLPMFLTALALAWVLGRQAGVDGMTLGLFATLLAAAGLWWTGRRQLAGKAGAWWPALATMALACGTVVLARPAPATPAQVAGTEPFTEVRLAALRAQGRPVFAYFTADWCLTCKVNEKAAIETDEVAAAFRTKNAAVLLGDWTDGDAKLGKFIEAHNRAGVPLYLWYPAGASEPQVLPQVLTKATLTSLR